jgi:mannosyltransferase OCH1-like enzyme
MFQINAIWIGDESKRPASLDSWGHVKVFGNETLKERSWKLRDKMRHYASTGELNGVADCMRWELLYEHGGIFIDADSEQVRTLPAYFAELTSVAAWENELERPGLIACGFLKFEPKDSFIKEIIDFCVEEPINNREAWRVVGPGAITAVYRKVKPRNLTVLPSHFFYPKHYEGAEYTGNLIYARQFWGSTRKPV